VSAIDSLLLASLRQGGASPLLVADENCLDLPFASVDSGVQVLSNRYDIAARARRAGLTTAFSDFDFSPWQAAPPSAVVYRISKEKPVVHHLANRLCEVLAPGARLVLVGGKQEGIKTFAKTLGQRFAAQASIAKHGDNYVVSLVKPAAPCGPPLDDRDYQQLREIARLGDMPVYSKPGVFGWNRVDAGSALLAGYLPSLLGALAPQAGSTLLDLGCGYGYLSLAAHSLGSFRVTATDNCAAALLACGANFKEHGVNGEVVAADCGDILPGPYQLILCNPPFHQGFHQDRGLTEKFLATTRRLLAPGGRALFVVNQFVPLETLARARFRVVDTPVANGSFKLVELA